MSISKEPVTYLYELHFKVKGQQPKISLLVGNKDDIFKTSSNIMFKVSKYFIGLKIEHVKLKRVGVFYKKPINVCDCTDTFNDIVSNDILKEGL
ncbi:hypothetical protein [Flyfo microvirus Tbat2_158]|nr:hypothetical protein [Flyfo microvirus Tbat2_158]